MSRHRLISVFLAAVLAFASIMKYLSITATSINPGLLGRAWWLNLGAVILEAGLGFWLLTGVFPKSARWISIAAFTLFAALSLFKGVNGEASCGCFGSLEVNPWITFSFDLVCLGLLASARPKPAPEAGFEGVVLLAGLGVLGLGVAFTGYESVTRISRRLVISKEWHEFGEVGQGQHLTYVFTLENHCGYAVQIAESNSTCFCTEVPDLAGHVIEAGASLKLPLTLHTGDTAEHLVGGVNLYCRRADSRTSPTFFRRLQVSAKVTADYLIRPLIIDFGQVGADGVEKRRIRFRPHNDPVVRVVEVTGFHPAITAVVLPEKNGDGDTLIELTLDGKRVDRTGPLSVPLTGRTTSRHSPTFRLLARADCQLAFEIMPHAVVVGSDVRGKATREVTLKTATGVRLVGVEASAGITASSSPPESTKREWKISVTIPESAFDLPQHEVKLTLCGPGGQRVVSVPVHRFPFRKDGAKP